MNLFRTHQRLVHVTMVNPIACVSDRIEPVAIVRKVRPTGSGVAPTCIRVFLVWRKIVRPIFAAETNTRAKNSTRTKV